MVTDADRNHAVERHEMRDSQNRRNTIAAATLFAFLTLQLIVSVVAFKDLESDVRQNTEARQMQAAMSLAQQERYVEGLMVIQRLVATMEALTKQVAVLAEQQEAFRRELAAQRKP